MKNQEIARHKQRLDTLFAKSALLPHEDEILAHWARYLCVQVSGFLEVSIKTIYREYAKNTSAPNIQNYVTKQLSNFQNPTSGKISNLVGSFNPEWEKELNDAIEGEIKDSIDSIINIRNKVAHGENSGIRLSTIKNYYENAVKLIIFLEKQCK
jgi:hypothetical protein